MQDPLRILVIYDNPSDPIVSLLASQQSVWQHNITLESLQLFIEQMQVHDQIDRNGVSIQWKLKNQDGSTKIWNNHDTYLLNCCHQFPTTWNRLFHPDDRNYAWNELTAYLNFAFTAFKYHIQPVSYYGLSGSVMPLFTQWDTIKGKLPELDVPSYYIGPYSQLQWSKAVINPDPYDVTHWVAEQINHDTKKDNYIFAYQKPIGQPVLVYITPIGADIVKDHAFDFNQEKIDEALLKYLAMQIGLKLGIRLGEILFFVSAQRILFGSATPRIIHAQNTPQFQALTLQALTTASAYYNPDHSLKYATQNAVKAPENFIAIGSTKDRTMHNLVTSQSFNKHGVFLPLEELTVTWDFSYTNGTLRCFTNGRCFETIGAIYYRPFGQQENKNDALELLHGCLDSFDGLVYGRGRSQHLNASKPLQLAHILPVMCEHYTIVLPDTIILKMIHNPAVIPGSKGTQYITKSISGIRSIVVNNTVFDRWEKDGLHTLPTLFQAQIQGDDIRVHVCHDQVFAVKITDKDEVDYRYAATFSIQAITIPQDLIAFCLMVSHVEQNPLIGIDLIETPNGYVFLEANPMPGWDFFYSNDEVAKENICHTIIKGA